VFAVREIAKRLPYQIDEVRNRLLDSLLNQFIPATLLGVWLGYF